MRCRACGTELIAGKAFCHACGARAPQACPHCGAELDPAFRFCPDCGQAVAPAAEEPPPAPAALSVMPERLAQKIRDVGGAVAGERKHVTILFCDLAGSTAVAGNLDPEVYRELLEQYVALALHEVYRFEGIVNQLSGDGFMALFGAPIAHEDAPQRAVHAALAIRDALAHFNHQLESERGITLPARIGINTGPVVVGTVGNDLKMDYTAIGDTTNLAARLEQLAVPGTILISEATARLVRGFFLLRPVGPLEVKGKSEPVPAYEVVSARDQPSPMEVAAERGLTPLVGRAEEVAQLDACYRRIAGRYTQLVSLVGDAGSGKSRLIYEFKQRRLDAGEPVMFFEGRCAALSQSVPLYPFVGMLRQYFNLTPGAPEAASAAKVERRLRVAAAQIDTAFPLLCRVLSGSMEMPADMPLDALKKETFEAVAKLVALESRRAPVVMILEDLHWIDESSQELLEMAAERLMRAPVMLLVSHRPEYRARWRTNAALTELHLRPLLDAEVAQIAQSLAGGALPAELEARIIAKADGSPFFAEELTRSLQEEGYITGDGSELRLTRPIDQIFIPGSVREVIAARLDRLGPAAKRIAQHAAVLGRQFRRSDLAELLAPDPAELDRELSALSQRGVIHRKSLFSDDEYRFGESLTQEVAYESLLLKQRRQLHERVAKLIERGGGDPSLARPELIAHHYALSDNREKAVETLLQAAAEAERIPSFRTAMDLCRQAWDIAELLQRERGDGDPRYKRWILHATLGYVRLMVLYGTSSDPDAERAAIRGEELAHELGETEAEGTLRTMRGMVLTADPSRFADGLALTERAVDEARASGIPALEVNASRALVWHYLIDGRFAAARAKAEWVVSELERAGETSSDRHLGSRWMRDAICFYSDDLAAAWRGAEQTLELAAAASNRTVHSGATSVLSLVSFARGQYDEARRWGEQSLETAEAIGNIAAVDRGQALVLAARVALGERTGMARLLDAIEQSNAKGGNTLMYVYGNVEALLALNEIKRAERVARQALELAGGRYRVVLVGLAWAEVLTRLGPAHWPDAERIFDRHAALAEAIGSRSARALALLGRGRLASARGLTDLAASAWSDARDHFAALGIGRYERAAEALLAQVGADTRALANGGTAADAAQATSA